VSEDERYPEQLKFLIADLGHVKSEIARRAGLQERALALYFVVIAFATHSLTPARGEGLSLLVPSIWVAALLVMVFWKREHLEIGRLGGVIREGIAKPAAKLLSVLPGDVVPSEMRANDQAIDPRTRALDRCFLWLSLVVIPLGVTTIVLLRRWDRLTELRDWRKPDPWLAVVSVIAAVATITLLAKLEVDRGATTDA
jgi:hypothetical protein